MKIGLERAFAGPAAAVMLLVAALWSGKAPAAELVMFEQPGCPWCRAFDREVAAVYPKTPEGVRAPLRKVDISRPLPPDLHFVSVERFTPVFVLVDQGREIGRIRGYAGEDHFWGLLGPLMKRLDVRPQQNSAYRGPDSTFID